MHRDKEGSSYTCEQRVTRPGDLPWHTRCSPSLLPSLLSSPFPLSHVPLSYVSLFCASPGNLSALQYSVPERTTKVKLIDILAGKKKRIPGTICGHCDAKGSH